MTLWLGQKCACVPDGVPSASWLIRSPGVQAQNRTEENHSQTQRPSPHCFPSMLVEVRDGVLIASIA